MPPRCPPFSAVKVFSATMVRERELLGERITEWLRAHPELQLVDRVVTQSSDDEFPLHHHHALLGGRHEGASRRGAAGVIAFGGAAAESLRINERPQNRRPSGF